MARSLEEAGISTVMLSGIREATEKVKPPRTVFISYPLGRLCGRPFLVEEQRSILRDVLAALETVTEPGTIVDLPYRWPQEETATPL